MSDDPLKNWRLQWSLDELKWNPSNLVVTRTAEREMRQLERARQDRMVFGSEIYISSSGRVLHPFDESRLREHGLPLLQSELALADWLEIPLRRLRWFTYDRPADTVWHYVRYTIPKRSVGKRVILAPKTELKALQRKILHELLVKVPVHSAAHGFVSDRSIVTNAKPHVPGAIVLKLDLQDFFPSITFRRVRGLFISLGYSSTLASTLAMLCTARDRIPYEHEGITYFVSKSERHLIQGAPTSPALSNLIARSLDKRLQDYANEHGITYTRYADDLTLSGTDIKKMHQVREAAYYIIENEGFRVNHRKTRLISRAARQMVTGIVVNEKTSSPRQLRRKIRAILHNAKQNGLQAQNVDNHPDFRALLYGLIGFVHSANPQHAEALLTQLKSISD